MTRYLVLLNRTQTEEFFPLFEIIYGLEAVTLIFFLLLTPFPIWVSWNALPLHRNLRIAFILADIHGAFGSFARLFLLYVEATVDNIEEYKELLSIATIIRSVFLSYFATGLANICYERCVATFFWSWYEKQSWSTVLVMAFSLLYTEVFCFWLSYSQMTEIHSPLDLARIIGAISIVGCAAFFALLRYNLKVLKTISKRPDFDSYSLSRTFQLRENVAIMKMLLKITWPVSVANAPAVIFQSLHYLIDENGPLRVLRLLSIVSFNLWIAVFSAIMMVLFPFFDRRLLRVAARNPFFARLFCTMRQAKLTAFKVAHRMQDQQNGDIYFNWLTKDLNKKRNSVGSITHQF